MTNLGIVDGSSAQMLPQEEGVPETLDQRGNQSESLVQVQFSAAERILANPLFGEPVLKTAPTREAYLASRERLLNGTSGMLLFGQQGMYMQGALKVMRAYLEQEHPNLALFEHVVTNCSAEWEAVAELLTSAGHGIDRGRLSARMKRLVNMQVERALISGFPVSVWIIHNSELLSVQMCKVFLDMRNKLQSEGVRLFLMNGARFNAFMTRVPELAKHLEPDAFRALFGSVYHLRALAGLKEYAEVLMEIETQTIHRDQPVTWIEALVPEAYQHGFRLSEHASDLHAAILGANLDGALSDKLLLDVIRNVMARAARDDAPGLNIPAEGWADALSIVLAVGSNYLQAIPGKKQ